jgi:hypothetical protein
MSEFGPEGRLHTSGIAKGARPIPDAAKLKQAIGKIVDFLAVKERTRM